MLKLVNEIRNFEDQCIMFSNIYVPMKQGKLLNLNILYETVKTVNFVDIV